MSCCGMFILEPNVSEGEQSGKDALRLPSPQTGRMTVSARAFGPNLVRRRRHRTHRRIPCCLRLCSSTHRRPGTTAARIAAHPRSVRGCGRAVESAPVGSPSAADFSKMGGVSGTRLSPGPRPRLPPSESRSSLSEATRHRTRPLARRNFGVVGRGRTNSVHHLTDCDYRVSQHLRCSGTNPRPHVDDDITRERTVATADSPAPVSRGRRAV